MSHRKSWSCIKPDGDGCDGNHEQEITDSMRLDFILKAGKFKTVCLLWGYSPEGTFKTTRDAIDAAMKESK